jgi:Rieske Fe-S protein
MAKSLNPHAAGQTEGTAKLTAADDHLPQPPRRNILISTLAIVIGTIVGIFPFGAGLLVFLDPVLKQRAAGSNKPTGEAPGPSRPLLRVSTVAAIPADGTPIQVPIIADLTDTWIREPNQPIGAVYLRRDGDKVECFNAICPHAGCFVGYAAARHLFQCPCHNSSFELDGERIMPSPAPRDMDTLPVDPEKLSQGEVWVEFINFYPGKEQKVPKP